MGDGQSVDVMDPQVDSLPMRLWPTLVSMDTADGLQISNLLGSEGAEWDVGRIGQLFEEHLAEQVRSLLVLRYAGLDVRICSTSCRANVRVGDIYRVLQCKHEPRLDCVWIWRFGFHPKMALFLWKVALECLPTILVLSRRGPSIHPLCSDSQVEETVDHILFQCERARGVWRLAELPPESWGQLGPFLQVVRRWADAPQTQLVAIGATFTVYHIWLARNVKSLV
ncbi:uncharacterized protein LOC103698828 [Phoenix dactylifera]|uniref:Uncharacterized protein LOC103698828 n=1 Tax=Phoenix dactylifera TaxID=42345 RepID=A0A8B7BK51_PHODC|nr:uncharacterized protein LOC103698828 [Phoenix dactylifera]